MAIVEVLTLSSVTSLFTLRGLYLVGYSWAFGMSLWVTFIGGVIAFKSLPRQQFGNLQHRTFPIYFGLSIGIGSALLYLWTASHPLVLSHLSNPRVADVAQAYTLASVIIAQIANQFVIGPLVSKTMFQRHKLEKAEGKSYNEEGVSAEMKALNKKFGALHGYSSIANLTAFLGLAFHGLWIGNKGLGSL
ncbi:TMEM205-like domain-containing protein [Abortiporus biennis]